MNRISTENRILVVSSLKLASDPKRRLGFILGIGEQIATTHFHLYNHALILDARFVFQREGCTPETRAESREPKAESQEPRAKSQEPRAFFLPPPTKLNNLPSISFRWPAFRRRGKYPHSAAFFGGFLSRLPASLSFAVERLRDWGRTSDFAQLQHFDLEISTFRADVQLVAHVDFAGRLGGLPIGSHSPQFTRLLRQRPRLEQSSRPQPRIHAYASHFVLSIEGISEVSRQSSVFGRRQHPS